ncbi:MAG: hypothetical protein ACTHZ5_14620 [Micrococcaceae bacterium]
MARKVRMMPGQTTIGDNPPKKNGSSWVLTWSIRLYDGTVLTHRRTQAPTKKQAREKAERKAEELLRTGGTTGKFTSDTVMDAYITEVTVPRIAKLPNANTRNRYMLAAGHLLGRTFKKPGHDVECGKDTLHTHPCGNHEEPHERSFHGRKILDALRFRSMETNLREIARLHGAEAARQARNVLSKYVVQEAIRDEIIDANPLVGMNIDLRTDAKQRPALQGQTKREALTRAQWFAAIDYLLDLDPTDVPRPKRGRWTLEDRIAMRRNTIDLALLQAASGLRQSEGLVVDWGQWETRKGKTSLRDVVGKGGGARRVLLFEDRVVAHLEKRRRRGRRGSAPANYPIIGSPTDPSAVWDRQNANKEARKLYDEVGEALGIPILTTSWGRSHIWRETLNMITRAAGVPAAVRASQFGHDEDMNARYYTDLDDVEPLLNALPAIQART